MNLTHKTEIADRLRAWINGTSLSQNKAAARLGISAANVSNILGGKWDQISDQLWARIANGLGQDQVVPTRQYQEIMVALHEAKEEHTARIIDGATGTGKTTVAVEFARQHPTETYYIRCADDMTARSFLQSVAEAVGASQQGNSEQIRRAITTKLQRDRSPLLLIDEAENLKEKAYGSIKAMYDDLEGIAGIVLIGANNYFDSLKEKAQRRRPGCFPQVFSRFKAEAVRLGPMTRADVKEVAKPYGQTDAKVINHLHQTCSDYRELTRRLRAMVRDTALALSTTE